MGQISKRMFLFPLFLPFPASKDGLMAQFSEPALPRQSILGLGRFGREADLRVISTNLLFGSFENLSQNSLLY